MNATLKTFLWNQVARRWPGDILRLLAPAIEHRRTVLGLANPTWMPHLTTLQAGGLYLSERENYIAVNSGRAKAVRFDPGLFEAEITFLMQHLIRPDDMVLDIGANIGFHTVTMARAAHRGHLYAFEPVAKMAEQNSANVALNRLDNVTIVRQALGNRVEERDMKINVGGVGLQGTSSFIDRNINIDRHPDQYIVEKIRIAPLDDIIGRLDLPGRIGFIKIDTEGYDTMVLEGAMNTIREHRPAMIVEAHTDRLHQAGKSWAWYLETFPDYHLLMCHAVTRAKPYLHLEPLTADQPQVSVNLVMLPRGKTVSYDDGR